MRALSLMQQLPSPPQSATPSRVAVAAVPAKRAVRFAPSRSAEPPLRPVAGDAARGLVAHAVSAAASTTDSLSDRAKHRLQLAAALLRSDGFRFEQPRAGFYDAIVQTIDRLRPEHRQRLRADVDWVEAYDREEQRLAASPRHARSSCTKPKPL